MEYLIHLSILVAIYAILALSLNLVVGYTGMISVTHAAFFGLGAYTVAILGTSYGVNFFAGMLAGIAVSAIAALLIGAILNKFRGDFVALGSVGFNVIVWSVFLNWQELTRGPLGIPGISRPNLDLGFTMYEFSDNFSFLILASCFLLLTYLAARFIEQSSFGRVLKAVREDEEALQVFGYRALHYKLAIFTIGAGMAAAAGALFAAYITFIDPSSFTLNESIFLLSVIILGGLASNRGSVIGAVALILLPEFLRFVGFPSDIAAQTRQAVYGVMLVVLMLYRPQGLVGEYKL
ncbi:MAG: branched-chain amino acid ABC transporter permease [Patescibacteria group bacterium]